MLKARCFSVASSTRPFPKPKAHATPGLSCLFRLSCLDPIKNFPTGHFYVGVLPTSKPVTGTCQLPAEKVESSRFHLGNILL